MLNSKLIQVLMKFSKRELNGLRKLLESPWFNKRKDVIAFLDYFELNKKKLNKITKELVHQFVYEKQKFNELKVRQLMSFVLDLVEEFLVQNKLNENRIERSLKLAEIYQELNLPRHFNHQLNFARQLLNKETLRDEQYLSNRNRVFDLDYNANRQVSRVFSFEFQEYSDVLNAGMIAAKLKQHCFFLAHQAVNKTNYEEYLLPKMLDLLELDIYDKYPVVQIYYHCYKAITLGLDGGKHFQKIRELLLDNQDQFEFKELRDIYFLAINYSIKQVNTGAYFYIQESLSLYKIGLELNYVFLNNEISRFTYHNIAALAINAKDLDWLSEFLESYKIKINIAYKETTYSYCKARLNYTLGNYDVALELLQNFESRDVLFQMGAKFLLLKIYYEIEAIDAYESLLESTYMYIHRSIKIAYQIQAYKNSLKFARKLIRLIPTNQKGINDFISEVENENQLSEKLWFLEKSGKLKK